MHPYQYPLPFWGEGGGEGSSPPCKEEREFTGYKENRGFIVEARVCYGKNGSPF
jgi:hypothetical protein